MKERKVKEMQALKRKATLSTPYVLFDPESNAYVIAGRSLPIDADVFYKPILKWFDELIESESASSFQLQIKLEYFNIASSKRILFILYKLLELQNSGTHCLVRWMYDATDQDMLEIGKDYSIMIENLHFVFEPYIPVVNNPMKREISMN